MATITQEVCDRCGKPLKYTGWTAVIRNIIKKSKRIKITKLFNGNPSGYDYTERTFHLCARCTEELKNFLRGAEEK